MVKLNEIVGPIEKKSCSKSYILVSNAVTGRNVGSKLAKSHLGVAQRIKIMRISSETVGLCLHPCSRECLEMIFTYVSTKSFIKLILILSLSYDLWVPETALSLIVS
jgi:hypothetical protein